jgi:hypothetical protein
MLRTVADVPSPQSWIGRVVAVARTSATEAEIVRLENLTRGGAVCIYQEAEVGEPVLIPWGSVSWLRLATLEEESGIEGESQPSDRVVSPEEWVREVWFSKGIRCQPPLTCVRSSVTPTIGAR